MSRGNQSARMVNQGGFGGAYFLAMIGAAVYFIQQTEGFWRVILALLKAAVWPAFLIHAGFKALGV